MSKSIDLTGQSFGQWTVLNRNYVIAPGDGAYWWCRCDCGVINFVHGTNLRNGHSRSCGCLVSDTNRRHGKFGTKIYECWANMKRRCYEISNVRYEIYGGRGITVCERWLEFKGFYEDMGPSYKEGLQIDRIDNDGNYCPENCRWVTRLEQAKNRRNTIIYKGKTLREWSKETGIKQRTLSYRVCGLKWSLEKAVSTPVKRRKT